MTTTEVHDQTIRDEKVSETGDLQIWFRSATSIDGSWGSELVEWSIGLKDIPEEVVIIAME